jgi:hypothetical protein
MERTNVVGRVPWSNTQPPRRRRWGDVLDHAPMFFDCNGHRTYGFCGELLRSYMDDVGWTCRDLQAASDIRRGRIESFVRGAAQPTELQVVALARALGVEPWQLCWA